MPIKDDGTAESRKQNSATAQAKRSLFTDTEKACQHEIGRQIRNGDHPGVWETICNGPDMGNEGVMVAVGERSIRVTLPGIEKVNMCDRLASFARLNGWDEDAGKAEVARMFQERRSRLAGVGRAMKGRART